MSGAKSIDELLSNPRRPKSESNPTGREYCSDLLLVVLNKYGIDPAEFLAGLNEDTPAAVCDPAVELVKEQETASVSSKSA